MYFLSCISFVSLTYSATLSGSDIRVPFRFHGNGHVGSAILIPAEYRIAETMEWVQGYAHFDPDLFLQPASSTIGILQEGITAMADMIAIRDESRNTLMAHLNISGIVPDSIESTLWSHCAVFIRSLDFPSFLIYFTNKTNGTLVLNPSNASDYAYNGELFYTSMMDENNGLDFSTTITLVPQRTSSVIATTNYPLVSARATINMGRQFTVIPVQIMNALIASILEIASVNDRFVTVNDPSDLELFPIIQVTPFGDHTGHIQMQPTDYLNLVGPGFRYELTVGGRGSIACVFGVNFFGIALVHVDYVNSRIGFGEPIHQVISGR